jgi:uncharacterized protein
MERKGDWEHTFTGKQFWPLDPKSDEIDLEDIAHGLSQQCRFNGHCKEFYSVAQHSVIVSKIVRPDQALAGLFHDAPETYIGDIVSPLKRFLPKEFMDIEKKIEEVIFEHFNIINYDKSHVKEADKIALIPELRDLMGPPPKKWNEDGLYIPLQEKIAPLNPIQAKQLFLKRYIELTKQ